MNDSVTKPVYKLAGIKLSGSIYFIFCGVFLAVIQRAPYLAVACLANFKLVGRKEPSGPHTWPNKPLVGFITDERKSPLG